MRFFGDYWQNFGELIGRSAAAGGGVAVIIPGPVTITPTLGTELLVNADFSDGSGAFPNGWSYASGTSGGDPGVSQVAPDGSAGTGAARFLSTATTTAPRIEQSILVPYTWHLFSYTVSAYTSGVARAFIASLLRASLTATGTVTIRDVVGAGISFELRAHGSAPHSFVFDGASAKQYNWSSIFYTISDAFVPLTIKAKVTRTANTQAGIAHYSDDDNHVIAYLNGSGDVVLLKRVAGVYTQVASAAVTYSAGALLELHYDASAKTYSVYYNDSVTPKINAASVADAVFLSAQGSRLFSTFASNSFSDIEAIPIPL